MLVDSVCRFMRIPFSIDTQSSAESSSWVMEFLKKNILHDSNTKSIFPRKLLQVGIRRTGLLYGGSVLNIKTEQASFLIGWTAVTMVTEEELVSIAYLKTAAPSVDQLYCHKFFIRSIAVALSVTNVDLRKNVSCFMSLHISILLTKFGMNTAITLLVLR